MRTLLEPKRKYIVLAVLLAALAIPIVRPTLGQTGGTPPAIPPDVQTAINDFSKAVDKIKTDKAKLSLTVAALDQLINPLRDYQDSVYVDQIISDLINWMSGLPDDASRAAALGKLARLLRATDVLRGKIPVPDPVDSGTDDELANLGPKLAALQDRSTTFAAVKALDAVVAPYRDRKDDAYLTRIIVDLTKWVDAQATDAQKKKSAVAKLGVFYFMTDALGTSFAAGMMRPALELTAAIKDNATHTSDADKVTLVAPLTTTDVALNTVIFSPLIHIVGAYYGDRHTRTRRGQPYRWCDATGYFRGVCEGKASCPPPAADPAKDTPPQFAVDGTSLCGFEPAPLAPDWMKPVIVAYACINTSPARFADAVRKGHFTSQAVPVVAGARIVCGAP